MAKRDSTRDFRTSVVSFPEDISEDLPEPLTVRFYHDDDPRNLWIQLHGDSVPETGFDMYTPLHVRIMQGCLLITTD